MTVSQTQMHTHACGFQGGAAQPSHQVDTAAAAVPQLAERLHGEITKLLADEGAKQRAAVLGERLRAMNGVEAAARKVLEFGAAGRAES